MTVGEAVLYYGVRLILFAAVAGAGIASGIKIRKAKNAKTTNKENRGLLLWQVEFVKD